MHRWWKEATTRREWCIFEYSIWRTEIEVQWRRKIEVKNCRKEMNHRKTKKGLKSLPTPCRPRPCLALRRSAVHRFEVSSMNRSWRSISTNCGELNLVRNHNRCFSDRFCSTEFRSAPEHIVDEKARFRDVGWLVMNSHPKSSVKEKKKYKRLLPQSGREGNLFSRNDWSRSGKSHSWRLGRERKGRKLEAEEAKKAFTSSNTSRILRIPMLVRQLPTWREGKSWR